MQLIVKVTEILFNFLMKLHIKSFVGKDVNYRKNIKWDYIYIYQEYNLNIIQYFGFRYQCLGYFW